MSLRTQHLGSSHSLILWQQTHISQACVYHRLSGETITTTTTKKTRKNISKFCEPIQNDFNWNRTSASFPVRWALGLHKTMQFSHQYGTKKCYNFQSIDTVFTLAQKKITLQITEKKNDSFCLFFSSPIGNWVCFWCNDKHFREKWFVKKILKTIIYLWSIFVLLLSLGENRFFCFIPKQRLLIVFIFSSVEIVKYSFGACTREWADRLTNGAINNRLWFDWSIKQRNEWEEKETNTNEIKEK